MKQPKRRVANAIRSFGRDGVWFAMTSRRKIHASESSWKRLDVTFTFHSSLGCRARFPARVTTFRLPRSPLRRAPRDQSVISRYAPIIASHSIHIGITRRPARPPPRVTSHARYARAWSRTLRDMRSACAKIERRFASFGDQVADRISLNKAR